MAGRHLLPALKKNSAFNYQTYLIPRKSHILMGLKKNHFDLTIYSGPITHRTTEVISDELYYYVGLREKFKDLEVLKSESELKSLINIFDRNPFENKWSNIIDPDNSGFFVDDHFSGRELILSGQAVSSYSLFYFSIQELKKLAI
jgi:hypothetical protein